jgi:molybdopterin-containing oxidoreductase family iron-sulfur binding subunit
MNRRTFLKIVGMGSISLAAGCTPDPYGGPRPDKTLYSLVHAPDDMVTGAASWYASTCRECPAGCGILAKNREGRVIKIEGNPLHPINQGKLCMRGQAALQGLYNPDRLSTPMLRGKDSWQSLTYSEAQALLQAKFLEASRKGANRVRMVTEVVGETLFDLFAESMALLNAPPPLIFEPFAYESLRAANKTVFGVDGLPSYEVDAADVLVSFGADFLETWLSPVEYARRFKAMHAIKDNRKGLFLYVGPYQSLTCANADHWMACYPGSEAVLALGLVKEALQLGRPTGLPRALRYELENVASRYTKETVVKEAGVSLGDYEKMVKALIRAERPLILGTGAGASGPNALQTDIAVNYLNLILDPDLDRIDFEQRHRVEIAAARAGVLEFFNAQQKDPADVLLLNNVNPLYVMPNEDSVRAVLENEASFVVSFSNFMDESSQKADLVFPVRLPIESWDEYGGKQGMISTQQPAMGRFTDAPQVGDVLLNTAFGRDKPDGNYKAYLVSKMIAKNQVKDEMGWLQLLQRGGAHKTASAKRSGSTQAADPPDGSILRTLGAVSESNKEGLTFIVVPSLRFFDGRGANRPWLCEVPDPITRVAWQTPVLIHPETLRATGLQQGERVLIAHAGEQLEATVYEAPGIKPGVVAMGGGQGHTAYGRYAEKQGVNPYQLLPVAVDPGTGAVQQIVPGITLKKLGLKAELANTDGSRIQYGRKIALSVPLESIDELKKKKKAGLAMWDFPLTLPLREGYDKSRDFYPPFDHKDYRWGMVVDMDRCIGCGACAVACYAENNIGIVGEARVLEGREMAWMAIERYKDPDDPTKITFLPLMCQHCNNAPCESVCPVYAPHHNKEGMNNQIYNRCIGTRYCSQNCPYKVRRFNWYDWQWPKPMDLQLNPNVTVRAKGVMEKCSFCIQRIKEAHDWAKNENRDIRDGEVVPACVQTCPTDALTFGNLMDKNSRVRRLVDDPRAYQIMGYLNTKTAVIYLKKVTQTV